MKCLETCLFSNFLKSKLSSEWSWGVSSFFQILSIYYEMSLWCPSSCLYPIISGSMEPLHEDYIYSQSANSGSWLVMITISGWMKAVLNHNYKYTINLGRHSPSLQPILHVILIRRLASHTQHRVLDFFNRKNHSKHSFISFPYEILKSFEGYKKKIFTIMK